MAAVHALCSAAQLLVCPPLLNARPARRRPYQSHLYATVARNAQYHAQPLSSNFICLTIITLSSELRFIYLTIKDRGCKPLYNSTTTVVSQLHQPGDISVSLLYTLLVKQQQLPDTYCVTVLRFSAGVRFLGIL